MTELKLTDEQIEQAAKMAFNCDDLPAKWDTRGETVKGSWRLRMRAAAPYLQAPITEPTIAEREQFDRTFHEHIAHNPASRIAEALLEFVHNRNAALTAKPDPRRKVIEQVFERRFGKGAIAEMTIGDEIIEQLDKMEAK